MSLVTSTVTSITVSHTIVYLNTLLTRSDLAWRHRSFLIAMCLTHLIQRVTMMFYMDNSISRNCTTLIVFGNLLGVIAYRYTLLHLLGALYRSMRQNDVYSKAASAISVALWVASSIAFMEHMLTAPITDASFCAQELTPWKTTVNNSLFLMSFAVISIPIIMHLGRHLRNVRSTLTKTTQMSPVDRIYYTQLYFLAGFIPVFLLLLIVQWFMHEWAWLLLDFIMSDYCWLHGIALFTFKRAPEESEKKSQVQHTGSKRANNSTMQKSTKLVEIAKDTSMA
ncbi:uncharacterized protein EV422DRAFT_535775 [Fimicolochytrium jonesii]|uniref:uncharacterized protein n=1 Tax=Fimicolochytrium jonesii TaxID=1396493 RepID=UPI0022FF2575|nr:uncharacterized protein EV422DRAFT_535775 [Fimicolochytrium jonesii]KAI8818875.1 hypothetical protein EV422DRAFT_535775 [Fimicolochytrium jonesii]